jgi:hypothetical protein
MEIGSEFWIDYNSEMQPYHSLDWLYKFGDPILTTSGRGALNLLLQNIEPVKKTVLLPAYICESVIVPFIKNGYKCYYYDLNCDLSPNIENILSFDNIGIFFHMGYYGFPTNSNLSGLLPRLRKQSTIIIEDVTHTLFSNFKRYDDNDYYIGSIRKWFGIPGGGFIASTKHKIGRPESSNNDFVQLRIQALLNKREYIKTGNTELKSIFLMQLSEAEKILEHDIEAYSLDRTSEQIIRSFDASSMAYRRKRNFMVLSKGFSKLNIMKAVFNDYLNDAVCPMFFPVFVRGDRDKIRQEFVNEKIYCPVHWPIPKSIDSEAINSLKVYKSILSIPCDQRYGSHQMERIILAAQCIENIARE